MKKSRLALGSLALLLLASCNNGYKEKAEQDSLKIAELTTNYQEATTFNDSLMLLMADIYNGLDSINMQEGLLYNMVMEKPTVVPKCVATSMLLKVDLLKTISYSIKWKKE